MNQWNNVIEKKPYLPGLLITAFIFVIYVPALNIYLMRDDFEWLNESYRAIHNPLVLFQTINTFFRPLVKVSYLFNYIFFKTAVPFYSLTTILIHLVNVYLLYIVLCRVSKRIHIASLSALAFGVSPFFSEVTLWAAGRPDSIVLIFIMGVLLCFTGTEEKEIISWKRQVGIAVLALCAAGSKETWILLPFFVLTLLLIVKQIPLKPALKKTSILFLLWGLYIIYFIALPFLFQKATPTIYNKVDFSAMVRKFGFLIFKYTGLGESFSGATWQYLLIILAFGLLTYRIITRKNKLALWGLIWMLLSIGISLSIFYAPSRYNYIPLLGFWVMLISFLSMEIKTLQEKFRINRRLVFLGIGVIFFFHIFYQAAMLQWEIADYQNQGSAHKQVMDMYNTVKDRLPRNQPIIFADISTRKAVDESARDVKGYRKLLFVRAKAIWQLVFISPLANFAGNPFKEQMEPIPENELDSVFQGEYTVLVFNDAAFFISDVYKPGLREYYLKYRKLPNKVQAVRFIQD